MSLIKIHLRACPVCGFDVARINPVTDGHKAHCVIDYGGCGAEAQAAATEALAAEAWNVQPMWAFGLLGKAGAA